MKRLILFLLAVQSVFAGLAQIQDGTSSAPPLVYMDALLPNQESMCNDAAFDADGNLWLSYGDRLFQYPVSFPNCIGFIRNDSLRMAQNLPAIGPGNAYDVHHLGNNHMLVAHSNGLLHREDSTWSLDLFIDNDSVFCVAGDENFWVVGTRQGIVRVKNKTYSRISLNGTDSIGHITSVAIGDDGVIYAGNENGIYRVDGSSMEHYTSSNSALRDHNIATLMVQKNRVWVGTQGNSDMHLYYFEQGNSNLQSFDYYTCDRWHTQWPIVRFFKGEDEEIWFNSRQVTYGEYSMFRINPADFSLEVFSQNSDPFFSHARYDYPFTSLGNGDYWVYPAKLIFNPEENRTYWENFHVEYLDINQVKAPFSAVPRQFFFGKQSERTYQVPKNTCQGTIYAGSPWFGAKTADNTVYACASTYNETDFGFGILDKSTGKADSAASAQLQLYHPAKVYRRDIEAFIDAWNNGDVQNQSFPIPPSLLAWPGNRGVNSMEMLAPFFDRNQDGYYRPADGDYPLIKGDQAVFTVYHDDLLHYQTGSASMGLEIHSLAYAWNCNNIPDTDSLSALNYTVFLEYSIHNLGPNDYTEFVVGQWTDFDLGNYMDDKLGADSGLNMVYVYNGSNTDSDYGANPPMQALVFLDNELGQVSYFRNDFSITGNPTTKEHYYYYLSGKDKAGNPLLGPQGESWKDLSGDPYDTTQYRDTISSDKRAVAAIPSMSLGQGQELKFTVALVYSRDAQHPNGSTTSWARLRDDVTRVHNWFNENRFPQCDGVGAGLQNPASGKLVLYPNPGNTALRLLLPGDAQPELAELYDLQGRLVMRQANAGNELSAKSLAPGQYLVRVYANNVWYTGIWVKEE